MKEINSVNNKNMRACVYNRCSTAEEEQINALDIQAEESREIVEKKGWTLIDQFVESKSGTTVKGRTKYQEMIEGINSGKYDIVVIKSIDRLARSELDWHKFIECIKMNHVQLYIYIDNKFVTSDDALMIGIKAILAADYSRELSKKIKNAHKRRQEKKLGYNITVKMFGWDKVDKNKFVVNEREANYIRDAYRMIEDGHGFNYISNEMYKRGARTYKKNKETGELEPNKMSTVAWRNILRSPRMYGTVVLHQKEKEFDTHVKVDVPEDKWVWCENAIPAIVSKDYFDRMIEIMNKRAEESNIVEYKKDSLKKTMPNKVSKYDLAGKIICGMCGEKFYRRVKTYKEGERVTWVCSRYLKIGVKTDNNPDGCTGINIIENVLQDIVYEAYMERFGFEKEYSDSVIDDYINILRKSLADVDHTEEIKSLNKAIEKNNKRKHSMMEMLADGTIDKEDFTLFKNKCDEEIKLWQERLDILESEMKEANNFEERLHLIKNKLLESKMMVQARKLEVFKLVDKILVYDDGALDIIFDKYKVFVLGNQMTQYVENTDDIYRIKKKYDYVFECDRELRNTRDSIERYIKEQGYTNITDLMVKFDLNQSKAYLRLKELKQLGKIEYIKTGKVGYWRWKDNPENDQRLLDIKKSIIEIITNKGKADINDLANELKVSKDYLEGKLRELRTDGLIEFVRDDRLGHWYPVNSNIDNVGYKSLKEQIYQYFLTHKEGTLNSILNELNSSQRITKKRLQELKADGKIEYTKTSGIQGIWRLVKQ